MDKCLHEVAITLDHLHRPIFAGRCRSKSDQSDSIGPLAWVCALLNGVLGIPPASVEHCDLSCCSFYFSFAVLRSGINGEWTQYLKFSGRELSSYIALMSILTEVVFRA